MNSSGNVVRRGASKRMSPEVNVDFMSIVSHEGQLVMHNGTVSLKGIIENQAKRSAQKFDAYFTTEITDRLYMGVDSEAETGESFDLLARNIQRGRDHGLMPYVKYLDYCLKKLKGIKGVAQLTLPTCLTSGVYESIADIDLFTGGIYETPLPGAIVGPTFACIIAEQFYRLKFGDRYYFETTDSTVGFKPVYYFSQRPDRNVSAAPNAIHGLEIWDLKLHNFTLEQAK